MDLFDNPERFTGYAGASANRVWKAIYEENCFEVVPFLPPPRGVETGGTGYVGSSFINDNTKNVRNIMTSLGLAAPRDIQDGELCLEKRVYYRLISGMSVCYLTITSNRSDLRCRRSTCIHLYSHLLRVFGPIDRRLEAESGLLHHPHCRTSRKATECLFQLCIHAACTYESCTISTVIRL